MSEDKRSCLSVDISLTDTDLFRDLLDVFVDVVNRLDDEDKQYFFGRINEAVGDRFVPLGDGE